VTENTKKKEEGKEKIWKRLLGGRELKSPVMMMSILNKYVLCIHEQRMKDMKDITRIYGI